jgi:hypothetical protein
MKSKKAVQQKQKMPSTQLHLPIQELREGTVVLKDGTLRAVLLVSSINFALKSEDEQNALIGSYVSFLNSLDFPLQIVIQSRKLQIKPYLESLAEIERTQTNELLATQIADYRSFITELVEIGQIMTKKFYVVVPYDPLSNKKKTFWSRTKELFSSRSAIKLKEKKFQERKAALDSRVRQTVSNLESMSLEVVQLDTQSLIELYYSSYNPDLAFAEQLGNITDIRIDDTV